jgi:hypothetical protein
MGCLKFYLDEVDEPLGGHDRVLGKTGNYTNTKAIRGALKFLCQNRNVLK